MQRKHLQQIQLLVCRHMFFRFPATVAIRSHSSLMQFQFTQKLTKKCFTLIDSTAFGVYHFCFFNFFAWIFFICFSCGTHTMTDQMAETYWICQNVVRLGAVGFQTNHRKMLNSTAIERTPIFATTNKLWRFWRLFFVVDLIYLHFSRFSLVVVHSIPHNLSSDDSICVPIQLIRIGIGVENNATIKTNTDTHDKY